jgi:uncharacterized protein YbjT (DUF2867 family)
MTVGAVLLTGATGRQGGLTLRHLLEGGEPVRRGHPQLRSHPGGLAAEEGWIGRRTITARRDKIGRPLPAPAQPTAPHAAS